MKVKDFAKYMDKKVRVTCTDGQTIHGVLDSIAPDYDTTSQKDELEIYVDGAYILIPTDEVQSIMTA